MRLCRLCKRLFPGDQAICPDDSTSTVEATPEPLPTELRERFNEPEPFALGATGTLYLVDRPGGIEAQLGPKLLLKVLAREQTPDASERARHRRDLRKQQALVHPQLPRVIEEGEVDGRVWFTREHVPATSLAVRLHKHGAFGPEAALGVIVQLAAALDGLHQLGLVHRDLKPGHVLLRPAQNGAQARVSLQLIDATFAAPLTADNPMRRGSPDYAATEIVEGAAATVRSDLYALGCLSYELITGVPPFRGASAAADGQPDTAATLAAQRGAEPKELPGNVPQAVRELITSLLSKDAHRRPFSAQQVRRSIEPILSPAKPSARRDARSALQREAAALRLTGPTAKPVTPRNTPDATVELDVEDLEEAIQASDQEQEKQVRSDAPAKPKPAVDDSAPTIALSASQVTNLAPQPAAASQVTPTLSSDKSATISNASAKEPTTVTGLGTPAASLATTSNVASEETSNAAAAKDATRGAQDTQQAAREKRAASAKDASRRVPDTAREPSAAAAKDASRRVPDTAGEPSAGAAKDATRGAQDTAREPSAAAAKDATPGAPDTQQAASAAHGPNAHAGSADASAPSAAEASADDAPLRARTGTKFGLGPVRTEDIEAAAAVAAQLSAASTAEAAEAHVESSERSAYPAVREAQPASAPSMERSAYPALRESQAAALQPAAASDAPVSRPKRYSASPKALMQSPRLLLWAAGGLVLLISGVRLAFGPAEATRSPSVVVRVPEVTTEVPAPKQANAELSELALIGGDIKRVKPAPLAAATHEQPQLQAANTGAVDEPEADDIDDDTDDTKAIRTVSAGSVRGALARAASNRQAAAESGKPVTSVELKAKGRELYQAGKYREAADAYQRATQHNTGDAAAFAGLGGSLLATGDTRKAIAAYQRAVHLEPAVSGFQAALGRAYLKKGDRAKARAAYTKALKLDPNNQAARNGMANAKAR